MMHPRKAAIAALTDSLKRGEIDRAKTFKPPMAAGLDDSPMTKDPGDMTKDSGDMEPDPNDPNEGAEGEMEGLDDQAPQGLSPEEAQIGMEHVDALKQLLEKK